jgi:hypothetical protein
MSKKTISRYCPFKLTICAMPRTRVQLAPAVDDGEPGVPVRDRHPHLQAPQAREEEDPQADPRHRYEYTCIHPQLYLFNFMSKSAEVRQAKVRPFLQYFVQKIPEADQNTAKVAHLFKYCPNVNFAKFYPPFPKLGCFLSTLFCEMSKQIQFPHKQNNKFFAIFFVPL